jgi:hypothetical protein
MLRVVASLAVLATIGGTASDAGGRAAAAAGCLNLRQAARTPEMVRKHALHGDVTGDRVKDRVGVIEDRHAAFRCRFAVAVFSGGRVLLYPLGRFLDKPSEAIGSDWPLIRLLARVDRRPGAEILLALSHGASFEQSQLLTVPRGRLQHLAMPGAYRGELDYGSVAAFGTNYDCRSRGSGVIVAAWYSLLDPQRRHWRYGLTRYRVAVSRLRVEGTRSATVRTYGGPAWWKRYYTEREPFRRCSIGKYPTPN